jgi:hypothetical protein
VGVVEGTQTINQSFVVGGNVTASGADPTAGGLVGRQSTINSVTLFIDSSAAANTNVISRDQTGSGGSIAGGLVGHANGIVAATDSFATGVITVREPLFVGLHAVLGGIVGFANSPGLLTRTFASTRLFVIDPQSGINPSIGGLVGSMTDGTVAESYWDGTAAFSHTRAIGNQSSTENVGRSTPAQMQDAATYAGWTLTTSYPPVTWGICESQSFPYLAGQTGTSPCFISGPAISGSAIVGEVLTVTGVNSPGAYSLNWGQVVAGDTFFGFADENNSTYTVSAQNLGDRLAVRAFRNQDGIELSVTSAATSPVTSDTQPPNPGGGGEVTPTPAITPANPSASDSLQADTGQLAPETQTLPSTYKIPKRLKANGTTIITRVALETSAGQRVRISFTIPKKRKSQTKITRRADGFVSFTSRSTKPMRVTIRWTAAATEGYEQFAMSRSYRTRM